MAENNENDIECTKLKLFESIAKNDINLFKQLLSLLPSVNFADINGMTPLQHASCKGNKQAVQILLDMGADVNYNQHGADYSPLHFAALSGKKDVCRILLDAGVNPNNTNSVSRTASQMAAFVGNYSCVETINNYVPRSNLEYYTKTHGQQSVPLIPPHLHDSFHEFVITVNLHPVRIALNLQLLGLLKYLSGVCKALQLMSEKEMKQSYDINELLAFKFHYLSWIVRELQRCEEQFVVQHRDKLTENEIVKSDFVELFIKRALKENKQGQLDYIEFTIRDCAREFPFRECTVFRQIVSQLAQKDPRPALYVLRCCINGQRGFGDESCYCSSCGAEKPDKKCSKCKAVQYCDRECQRLHWFMHKKSCSRSIATKILPSNSSVTKPSIDVAELKGELIKMNIG